MLDGLHLTDVLLALRNAGYAIDRKIGMLKEAGDARKGVGLGCGDGYGASR
jgi:hypothetical protein